MTVSQQTEACNIYSCLLRSIKIIAHQGRKESSSFLLSYHIQHEYRSLIQGTYKVSPYTFISRYWFDIFRDKWHQLNRQYCINILVILNFDINCTLEKPWFINWYLVPNIWSYVLIKIGAWIPQSIYTTDYRKKFC